MNEEHSSHDLDDYGDPGILSAHAPVPKWLKWSYILLPLWGLLWFYLYGNGSYGWLDRGYWHELQKAANTTFPIQNLNDPGEKGIHQAEDIQEVQ